MKKIRSGRGEHSTNEKGGTNSMKQVENYISEKANGDLGETDLLQKQTTGPLQRPTIAFADTFCNIYDPPPPFSYRESTGVRKLRKIDVINPQYYTPNLYGAKWLFEKALRSFSDKTRPTLHRLFVRCKR